jgi:ParB-like chromosome segregation protein Spo0J
VKSLLDKITRVKIEDLHQYPGNAKKGDVPSIKESLEENDQFVPVVVQKSTMYILSGNHTVQAAQAAGWDEIDAVVIDVDDRRALKINLAANRTADRGSYDVDARAALLDALEGDYEGTGYTAKEVEKWSTGYEEPLPEPGDVETEEQERAWGVIVTCADEKEQTALLKRFAGEGLVVRALML